MSRGVVVTPRVHKEGGTLSVALDTNFLGTPWARKVYRLDGVVKFPDTAHVHDGTEIVIPHAISGQALIGYKVDGEIHQVQLEMGCMYKVEPMVPHQFYGNGQMMIEVWSPTRSLISPTGTVVESEDDFFAHLPQPRKRAAKA